MSDIAIEPYSGSLFEVAVDFPADAYLANPTNVAVFCGSREKERRRRGGRTSPSSP